MPARPLTASWACSRPRSRNKFATRLADTLRWVISQRLAPRIGGGRYALLEIMGANLRTRETIIHGESEGKSFYEIIESNYTFGWRNFDQACLEAYEKNIITEETRPELCQQTRHRFPRHRCHQESPRRRQDQHRLENESGPGQDGPPSFPTTLKLK